MKTITLAKAWSYVTPEKTIDYPAGDHEVTNEIAEAAEKAGATKEESNGNRAAATGPAGSAGTAKG
jgi:hypothetical protein